MSQGAIMNGANASLEVNLDKSSNKEESLDNYSPQATRKDHILNEEVAVVPDVSNDRCPLDEVLMEALRVPRDRIFILRQEKDIEDRLRGGQDQSWELPLMNSYQRLLVHRIADHFHLAHSIDASTKAVTLSRQVDTEIPELSLSTLAMADMERLSESPYPAIKDSGSVSGSFKIMRREGTGRSDSPRNGQLNGENGLVRDRRNMTIEEREAAYKEARLRIFGSEESSTAETSEASSISTPIGEIDVKGLSNLSLESESSNSSIKIDSRKGTPGRVSPAPSSASSNSSAAFLRAAAPSFDPSQRYFPIEAQWQAPHPMPMVDMNSQPYYLYPPGYGMPMIQHDMNGRQIFANQAPMYLSPNYPYPHQEMYLSASQSPSASSRFTSIAGETEHDQNYGRAGSAEMASQGAGTSRVSAGSNPAIRPQSLSPAPSVQRGPLSNSSVSHVYQGQVPISQSWNANPMQSMPSRVQPMPVNAFNNTEIAIGRGPIYQQMGYAAAVMGRNLASSSHSSLSSAQSGSVVMSSQTGGSEISGQDSDPNGYGSRGRSNHSERSLFDPSKPANGSVSGGGSNASSAGGSISRSATDGGTSMTARHPLGKSVSASVLEGNSTTMDQRSATPPVNGNIPLVETYLNQRVSSSSSSVISSVDASRRGTPPTHPSLPARPDWAMQQKGRVSQLSNSSINESSKGT